MSTERMQAPERTCAVCDDRRGAYRLDVCDDGGISGVDSCRECTRWLTRELRFTPAGECGICGRDGRDHYWLIVKQASASANVCQKCRLTLLRERSMEEWL